MGRAHRSLAHLNCPRSRHHGHTASSPGCTDYCHSETHSQSMALALESTDAQVQTLPECGVAVYICNAGKHWPIFSFDKILDIKSSKSKAYGSFSHLIRLHSR